MAGSSHAKYRLFYTQDGTLTLTGTSIPETRGVAALALLRYLPSLQTIHFADKSSDILEYDEATGKGLNNVYILTTNEENICLHDLVQTIVEEETVPWDSLQQRQGQKADSSSDRFFNTCVLVVGCTLMSAKDKQNLIVCDLNSLNGPDTNPVSNLSFYEALYMRPMLDSKQVGGTPLYGDPKFILPGYMLLLTDVCFSMKVPQFPKLMIRPQSRVWNLLEDLPHDWSLVKHREATRLFTQLKLARMHCNIDSYTSILGREIYNHCFRSMRLKPLVSDFLSRTGEIYKKTAAVISAEVVEPKDGRIQLKIDSKHGNVPVIISEVYRNENYLKEITEEITQLARRKTCVLILLSSSFQQDFISVTNAPNKVLFYIRDPFEDLFPVGLEEPSHDNTSNADLSEPPVKRVNDNKPQSTAEIHSSTSSAARPLIKGPPLATLLPPYAIASRDICYSVTPDPLASASALPQDFGEVMNCEIKFSNLTLLWKHIQGSVYPYHRYTKPKDSRHLVYSSSPAARILSATTLLIDIIIDNDTGPEKTSAIVSHALLHELFLQIIPSPVGRETFELSDPETGDDLRDELPCLWPNCVLCTIYELKIPRAKLLILHTKLPLPPDDIPSNAQHSIKYLLDLDMPVVSSIK